MLASHNGRVRILTLSALEMARMSLGQQKMEFCLCSTFDAPLEPTSKPKVGGINHVWQDGATKKKFLKIRQPVPEIVRKKNC